MNRDLLVKSLTIAFGIFTIYYLLESLFNIFYYYPYLFESYKKQDIAFSVQQGLFNKAIITYFHLIIYSFISLTFLTTPKEGVKNIHLLVSILIFAISLLFFKQIFESNLLLFFLEGPKSVNGNLFF